VISNEFNTHKLRNPNACLSGIRFGGTGAILLAQVRQKLLDNTIAYSPNLRRSGHPV